MRSEFALAKRWFRFAAVIQWTMVAIAAHAIWTGSTNSTTVVVSAFLGSLIALICHERGKHYYSKGEKVRRLHMLQEGIGLPPSDTDMLDILANEARPQESEPRPIGSYYAPSGEGMSRLLHQLQESSFWTGKLARAAMWIYYSIAATGVAVTCVAAMLVLRAGSQAIATPQVDYARLFSTLLLFFLASSTITTARSFHALADAADQVTKRASALRVSHAIEWTAVHKLLNAYDIALAKAQPIPSYVYRARQVALQAAWDAVR